jgi:hypothetical protein
MNFYIGNSVEEINPMEKNVELCDDLLEYLNKHKKDIQLKRFVLQEIDPYDDNIIKYSELKLWQDMWELLMVSKVLEGYEDSDEARCIRELFNLFGEAICLKKNIIVIGD